MVETAGSGEKAGWTGALQTLDRIHQALVQVSYYRDNQDFEMYYNKLKTVYSEVDAFLKDTEKECAKRLIDDAYPFVEVWTNNTKMANRIKLKDSLWELELFLKRKLHKYNLLMPRETGTGIL